MTCPGQQKCVTGSALEPLFCGNQSDSFDSVTCCNTSYSQ